ncbi:2-keto-3-deoxy-6-phosphogluconate aldolase, partial [Chryseobacterium populi]
KIFPADALGQNYIKSVQPVFPGMNFMPTGGINADIEDITEWLKGGAIAVGLGSSLIKKELTAEQLTEKVKKLLQQLNQN